MPAAHSLQGGANAFKLVLVVTQDDVVLHRNTWIECLL